MARRTARVSVLRVWRIAFLIAWTLVARPPRRARRDRSILAVGEALPTTRLASTTLVVAVAMLFSRLWKVRGHPSRAVRSRSHRDQASVSHVRIGRLSLMVRIPKKTEEEAILSMNTGIIKHAECGIHKS
jgi:hypothetical protein